MSLTWKGRALNKWIASDEYQKNWEKIFGKNKKDKEEDDSSKDMNNSDD